MNKEHFDDETLMAFADGELDEATTLRVEAALETDEKLAERLAVFFDSRELLASTLKPLIDEAVPDVLAASVAKMAADAEAKAKAGDASPAAETENVVAFHPRQVEPKPVSSRAVWLMPIAASVLAVVTGIGGFVMGGGGSGSAPAFDPAINRALASEFSGRDVALGTGGDVLHLVASFKDGRGELCREYELRGEQEVTATVACRRDGAWVTRFALSSPRAEGYVPASSQETIDAYLSSIEAGAPLSVEEEQKLLSESR